MSEPDPDHAEYVCVFHETHYNDPARQELRKKVIEAYEKSKSEGYFQNLSYLPSSYVGHIRNCPRCMETLKRHSLECEDAGWALYRLAGDHA